MADAQRSLCEYGVPPYCPPLAESFLRPPRLLRRRLIAGYAPDEVHQFFAGAPAPLWDIGIDVTGASASALRLQRSARSFASCLLGSPAPPSDWC
jgi:hypothetical protein